MLELQKETRTDSIHSAVATSASSFPSPWCTYTSDLHTIRQLCSGWIGAPEISSNLLMYRHLAKRQRTSLGKKVSPLCPYSLKKEREGRGECEKFGISMTPGVLRRAYKRRGKQEKKERREEKERMIGEEEEERQEVYSLVRYRMSLMKQTRLAQRKKMIRKKRRDKKEWRSVILSPKSDLLGLLSGVKEKQSIRRERNERRDEEETSWRRSLALSLSTKGFRDCCCKVDGKEVQAKVDREKRKTSFNGGEERGEKKMERGLRARKWKRKNSGLRKGCAVRRTNR